jgi:hypothetical protein
MNYIKVYRCTYGAVSILHVHVLILHDQFFENYSKIENKHTHLPLVLLFDRLLLLR